mmetsp:Transcript_2244/g.5702  ORF Transcript_2244/g.5702 Transcript_2244/m.5702 type:complete len:82 (+) Transcript_2244:3-248(+)
MGMGMGSMGGGMALPAAAAPAAAPAGVPPGQDVTALLSSMSVSGSSNADLIRMLAEEVVRLRRALEEKRARASMDMPRPTM